MMQIDFIRMNADHPQTEAIASPGRHRPKYTTLLLLLILLLGFGLRVAGLTWGQAFCYGSQGACLDAYQVAVNFEHGEPGAQYIGQPNFNHHSKLPGPLWAAFCALCLWLLKSTDGVVWAIILLNTAAIYLTYLLAARTVGFPAALWAALLMATSPEAVEYSVVIFNPVVMSFLGACLFLALWQVTQRDRSRATFWLFFLPLIMLQFHLSGLMLIPAIIAVLWLSPVQLNFPCLVAGFLAGLALFLPYFFGEMAHGWANTHGMILGASSGFSVEAFKAFSAPPGFLINYWGSRWTFRPDEYEDIGRACFGSYGVLLAFNVASIILATLLVIGGFLEARKALSGFWRTPRATFARSSGMVFLTIVFVMPLLASLVHGQSFRGRYCLVLLAPLFSLAAMGAVRCLSWQRIRRFVMFLLVVTLVVNVWIVLAVYHFQGKCIKQGPIFAPTFEKLETVYQILKNHAGKDRPIEVEDKDYLQALLPGDKIGKYPEMISEYVAIREQENTWSGADTAHLLTYKLYRAEQVSPDDAALVYREKGIALIALPDQP
jgi:hypothetical protein